MPAHLPRFHVDLLRQPAIFEVPAAQHTGRNYQHGHMRLGLETAASRVSIVTSSDRKKLELPLSWFCWSGHVRAYIMNVQCTSTMSEQTVQSDGSGSL